MLPACMIRTRAEEKLASKAGRMNKTLALNEDVQQVQPRSMDEIERRASRITRHESRLFPRRAVVPSPEATAARITVFMVFPKHESRDTCLPTRQANHGFPAFGTEALQSCFGRPGRRSMTTGRLEIDLPSPLGARASLPCEEKSGEKSGEKNRGGDITPIRLRRSLFFVAPATPAGRPSRRQPGETVQALPGRAGRAGCALPRAPKLPKARSCCRKEWPAIDRLPSCRKSSARITAFPSRRPFAASRSRPRHAPRDTNHGLYGRSLRRGCARVAQPETAARTAAPAAKSLLPCPELLGGWGGIGVNLFIASRSMILTEPSAVEAGRPAPRRSRSRRRSPEPVASAVRWRV